LGCLSSGFCKAIHSARGHENNKKWGGDPHYYPVALFVVMQTHFRRFRFILNFT